MTTGNLPRKQGAALGRLTTFAAAISKDPARFAIKLGIGVRPVNRTRTRRKLPFDPPHIGVRLELYGQLVVLYFVSDVLDGVLVKHSGKFATFFAR